MTDEELIERFGFRIEDRDGIEVLQYGSRGGGCRPASAPEIVLWGVLQSLTARVAELETDKAHYANLYADKAEQLSRADTELTRLKAVNEELVGLFNDLPDRIEVYRILGKHRKRADAARAIEETLQAFSRQALSRVEQGEKG